MTEYRSLLRNVELKATPARLALLKLFHQTKIPLSISTIQKHLKNTAVNQVTIYRIINAFEKNAIIKTVDFQHGHAHYELLTPDHHHHLICEKCGKIADISKCNTAGLEKQALKISGFAKINQHSLEFFGLCNNCAKTAKNY